MLFAQNERKEKKEQCRRLSLGCFLRFYLMILVCYIILILRIKRLIRIALRMDPSVAEIRDRCVENIGRRVYTGLAGDPGLHR